MTYQTFNPATGEWVASYPGISDSDLELAIAKAHKVYKTDWQHRSIDERGRAYVKSRSYLARTKIGVRSLFNVRNGQTSG